MVNPVVEIEGAERVAPVEVIEVTRNVDVVGPSKKIKETR